MRRALVGKKIDEVEIMPDDIVFGSTPHQAFEEALKGKFVTRIGRKGKAWWVETGQPPAFFGHLGMSGWIRELGSPTIRLKEHGNMPLDDETGRPRFLKWMLTTSDGTRVAMTDGRRLARAWLSESAEKDQRIRKLGPDAYDELPEGPGFHALFQSRKAPIKALLMDQGVLSGIGNWIADEVLYHSGVAPMRPADSLSGAELEKLRAAITNVIHIAVEAGADEHKYPEDWLFHVRWGGSRGPEHIGGKRIIREQVGGRTTAWAPDVQR